MLNLHLESFFLCVSACNGKTPEKFVSMVNKFEKLSFRVQFILFITLFCPRVADVSEGRGLEQPPCDPIASQVASGRPKSVSRTTGRLAQSDPAGLVFRLSKITLK